VNNFVDFRREWRGSGFVVVVVVVVGLFGGFDEGKVDRVTGLCSEGVKVKVREEFSLCAKGDGVGVGTTAAPKDGFAIVGKVKVIVAPVDEGVDGGKPRFAKNEVVVGEWVGECIEFVGIVVAVDGKSGCEGGEGGRTVGEDDRNGGTMNSRERVLFAKRRRDDVPLSTAID
jgi:hypothetical protein